MLDSLSFTKLRRVPGPWVATPSDRPPGLRLLAKDRHRRRIFQWRECPCCDGRATPLLLNLVVPDRVILLDTRFLYCATGDRLLLPPEEIDSVCQRLAAARTAPLTALEDRRSGIGGRIRQPLLSMHLRSQLIGRSTDRLWHAADHDAVVLRRGGVEEDLPSAVALAFHSDAFPDHITLKIEPTTRCNFTCEFCYGRHLAQGTLESEDFWRILDRFSGLRAVELTGEGEPLLNKGIYDLIAGCAERGLWTHLTTNGSLLNQRNCERLLQSGLSSLAVSLESFDENQFARLRPGGDLIQVLQGLERIARLRRERDSLLELRLWVTLLRSTLAQIDAITRFAKRIALDRLEYQALNPMTSYRRFYSAELASNMLSAAEIRSLLADPDASSALRGALGAALAPREARRCDVFMHTAMVNWRGEVTPCCLLKAPDFPALGNLREEIFSAVWNSEDFVFFRFALQHGAVLKDCHECPNLGEI